MFDKQIKQFTRSIEKALDQMENPKINDLLQQINTYIPKKEKHYFFYQVMKDYDQQIYGYKDYENEERLSQIIKRNLYPYKAQYQSLILEIEDRYQHIQTIEIPRYICASELVYLILETFNITYPYMYELWYKDDTYVDVITYKQSLYEDELYFSEYDDGNYSLLCLNDQDEVLRLYVGINSFYISIKNIIDHEQLYSIENSHIVNGMTLTKYKHFKYLYKQEYLKYEAKDDDPSFDEITNS